MQPQPASPLYDTPFVEEGQTPRYWRSWFSLLWAAVSYKQLAASVDFPNTVAQTSSPVSVSISGVKAGDFAEITFPVAPPVNCAIVLDSVIDGAVVLRFCNFSAGAIDPGSLTVNIRVRAQ